MRVVTIRIALGALTFGSSLIAHAQVPDSDHQAAMRAQAEAGIRQHYETRTAQYAQDSGRREVVMLGDSLTEGNDWQAAFPNVQVANRGIDGDSTQGMLKRLDTVLDLKPKKVFVMAGINDLSWYRRPVREIFQRYTKMIDALGQGGATVYVQSTLKVGPVFPRQTNAAVADLNDQLRAYCDQGHCRYIDLNPVLAPKGTLGQDYTYDQLHLNAAGYEKWAQAIRKPVTDHHP